MNGPPWVTRLKEGGLKRLIIVSAVLVCLYVLATGGSAMLERFLFVLGDETSDGDVDVFVGGSNSCRVWRGDGSGRFDAGEIAAYR